MNPHVMDLGFILRQVPGYEDFTMARFEDRLKLQKTIYLLQAFGVHIGYDYNWYLRGPYCSNLAANGFVLEDYYPHIPRDEKIRFKGSVAQGRFLDFLKFMDGKSIDDLEIAASLHYQVAMDGMDEEGAKRVVVAKQHRFKRAWIDGIWDEIRGHGLVG